MDASEKRNEHAFGWQILGRLEMPIADSTEDVILAWLTKLLSPITLPPTFFERFLSTVQASVRRVAETAKSVPGAHIHLSILVLPRQDPRGKSWGFFQIERATPKAGYVDDQVINFYLYTEGD